MAMIGGEHSDQAGHMKEVTGPQLYPCSDPRTGNQGTSHDGMQLQGPAWRFLPWDGHCS